VNARIFITAGAVVALAAPAAATAKLIPIKEPAAKHATKHVVKRHVTPRVLCICTTIPLVGVPPVSEAELEAQIDADMIAHGLDPLYGPTPANVALEGQYDAQQVAYGLNPVFGVAALAAG
jgi:hypothetical protein